MPVNSEITFTDKPKAVQIPGMEAFNENALALAATIPKCALVKFGPNGAELNTLKQPAGVSLEVAVQGETFGFGTHCEIAGFTDGIVSPGELIYPSAAVAGGMVNGLADGTVPAKAIANAPACGRVTPDGKRIKILTV